jgi:outer membrane murein-binding lipoprotein Lpp
MIRRVIGRRLLLVAVPALVAALLAAGCGGSDDETGAEAWANDLCTSVTTWTDQVETSVNSLSGGNLSRNTLSTAVDDVGDATDTLEDDLRNLGPPDTDAGEEAQEAVTTLGTELQDGIDQVQTAFEGASTVTEVLNAASVATSTIATMWGNVTSTFTTLEGLDGGGELQSAFEDSSECQDIQQRLSDLTSSSS